MIPAAVPPAGPEQPPFRSKGKALMVRSVSPNELTPARVAALQELVYRGFLEAFITATTLMIVEGMTDTVQNAADAAWQRSDIAGYLNDFLSE